MFRKCLIHFMAECSECDWETEDYINGQRLASEHARKTGHHVEAEEGYAVKYGEKKEAKKADTK